MPTEQPPIEAQQADDPRLEIRVQRHQRRERQPRSGIAYPETVLALRVCENDMPAVGADKIGKR